MKNTILIFTFFFFFGSLFAQENQKRIALIIGNADYEHSGKLKNPVNDASLLTKTLEELNFTVIKKTNANLREMQLATAEFTEKISNYDVALFFYAGHGIQVDGENYIIPVNAEIETREMAQYDAFNISFINKAFMQNSEKINIMILDACRNNPFRSWQRGGESGFRKIENSSKGTIIAFATQPGATAFDGLGENGLYTSLLVDQMKKPQNIETVLKKTRIAVNNASKGKQIPQDWSSLMGDFYFTKTNIENDTESIISETSNKGLQKGISKNNFVLNEDFSVYVKGMEIKMHGIEGGTFDMGKKNNINNGAFDAHKVTLNNFAIMKYEVTVAEFEKFIKETGYKTDADNHNDGYGSFVFKNGMMTRKNNVNWKYDVAGNLRSKGEYNHPVIHVSWNDACAYAEWISNKTGKTWRLPTDAEWEFAARGNKNYKYAGSENIEKVAWYWDNSKKTTHSVGKMKPNGYGLYDMNGNVREWCLDWFDRNYCKDQLKNPKGPESGSRRVIRGGSTHSSSERCNVTYRTGDTPSFRIHENGFRLVLEN